MDEDTAPAWWDGRCIGCGTPVAHDEIVYQIYKRRADVLTDVDKHGPAALCHIGCLGSVS